MTPTDEQTTMDAILDVIDRLIERVVKAEEPTYPLPPVYLRMELQELRDEAEGLIEDLIEEEGLPLEVFEPVEAATATDAPVPASA